MAVTVSQLNDFKKLLETGKLILGAERTLKMLRAGKVAKVWLSKNVAAGTLDDIKILAKNTGAELVEMQHSNVELGELCRKQFSVSVVCTEK